MTDQDLSANSDKEPKINADDPTPAVTTEVTDLPPVVSTTPTPDVDPEPTPEPAPEPTPEGDPAPVEPPAYNLNPNFKVMDQEHKFDEFLHGSVTNEAQEKQLREIYEKAYGLDVVKPKYQAAKEQLKSQETQVEGYNDFVKRVSDMRAAYERGDFPELFQGMGIDEQKVLQWVVKRVNYEQSSPEEKLVHDRQTEAERRAYSAEQRVANLEQSAAQNEVESLRHQMSVAFADASVQNFEKSFDAKVGREGAFRDEVLTRGELAWATQKRKMTAQEAVDEVRKIYGPVAGQPPQTGGTSAAPGTQAPPNPDSTGQAPVKVLPNVRGSGASPLKQTQIRSMDDLKARAREMGAI